MKKQILTFSIIIMAAAHIMAANYYWVGGSGNWSDFANHWATSPGGSTFHTQPPTASDNVYFDAHSFTADSRTLTIDTDAVCADMSWVGAQHEPILERDGNTTRTLSIYGSLTFIEEMDFNFLGRVNFESALTGREITSAGQTFKQHVYFQGEGGYILMDDFNQDVPSGNFDVYFVRGSLDLNNKSFRAMRFRSDYTNVRVLTLGASTIEIYRSSTTSNDVLLLNGTNLTLNEGESLIKFTGSTFRFTATGDLKFHNVLSESTSGTIRINSTNGTFNKIEINNTGTIWNGNTIETLIFNGNGTINSNGNNISNLTFHQTATINGDNGAYGEVIMHGNGNLNGNNNTYGALVFTPGKLYSFRHGNTHIIGDVLTANGTCAAPIIIESSSSGNQATIRKTSGTVTVDYCHIKDINTEGGASFTANNSFDLGNNTGWTINGPAPASFYWIGGTGSWNEPANWSSTSGGPAGNCIPSALDDVYFDALSFSALGQTVTIAGDENNNAWCKNLNFTGVTGTPDVVQLSISQNLNIYGSITLVETMNWNFNASVYFKGGNGEKSIHDISSAGQTFKRHVYINGEGTYRLQDDFVNEDSGLYLVSGGLDLNEQDMAVHRFLTNNTNNRTLSLGASTITIAYSGVGNAFEINSTKLAFDGGASFLRFTGAAARFVQTGESLEFNDLLFEAATGTSRITASGSSFNSIEVNNAGILSGGNTINTLLFHANGTINGNDNQINTLSVHGDASINDNEGQYGHVTLHGNGNLYGTNNTYGTLILSAGNLYKFQSNGTQYITEDLQASGTEEEPIVIEARTAGSQATISKASGTVTLEYVSLQDNKAVGGATFVANNSLDMGNNDGWTINIPGGRDLYWVGGTGNWNDASNWSLESNGVGGAGIPSFLDNVIFNEYSFEEEEQIVTIIGDVTDNAYCNNISWTGVTGGPVLYAHSSQTLNIHGSLTLVSGMVWDFRGDVYFKGEGSGKSSYAITSAGQDFKRHVYFQGTGNYTLQDDFAINSTSLNLYFENGGLILNDINLSAGRFLATTNNQRTLSLGNSTIILSYSHGTTSNHTFILNANNLDYTAGTTLFRFTGAGPGFNVTNGNLNFHNLIFEGSGTSSRVAAANCSFNDISFNHRGSLSGGGVTVNSLTTGENATISGDGNNITTLVVNGTATINNINGNYGQVSFNGSGNLNGNNNTYGTLIFTPGNLYKFQSGQTHHITDDWFANGTEEQQITIEASAAAQAIINKASGNNVVVEWVKLKSNKAVGGDGVAFTANNSFDEGNNEGWIINAPGGRDLYWVGGTGNWNDASNWSLESNGVGGAGIPSFLDNVIFNEYSFEEEEQIVAIIGDATDNAYCNNMTWTGVTGDPVLYAHSSQTLNIHGSLTLVSGMVWDFQGDVNFKGEDTGKSAYTIISAGQTFKNDVYFQGSGNYELEDDFEIIGNNRLTFENGGLVLNDILLKAHQFWADTGNPRTLDFGSSTIELSHSHINANAFSMNETNLDFDAGTSLIRLTGSGPGFSKTGSNLTFHNVTFESSGTGRISAAGCTFMNISFSNHGNLSGGNVIANSITTIGNATIGGSNNTITTLVINGSGTINNDNGIIGHAALNGDASIIGSNTFGTLILTAGKTYTLTNGKIQTILTELVAEGTCAEPMTIQSNSTTLPTTIHKASGTVTVTRAFMRGLAASGDALFEAINSVDIDNSNIGWEFIVVPENLYWVGGSGNWSDVNKWANEPGEAGGYCVPSRLDNVIFNANSFFQEAQFVQIDIANAECYNMDWTDVQYIPTFLGAQTNNLSIYGSLTFSPAMNFTFAGNVYFEGQSTAKSDFNIISAGKSFNSHVYFNGMGGEWNLLDNFSAGGNNIYLEHGTLNTNDNSVTCGRFISNNSNTRALKMAGSSFSLSSTNAEAWLVNSSGIALEADDSEIIFTAAGGGLRSYGADVLFYDKILFRNTGGASTLRSNHQFNDVVFHPVGTIRDGGAYGNVTMHRGGQLQNNSTYSGTVKLYGNTTISGTNNFGRLLLGAGNIFTFPANQTQTITGRFIIWGSAANTITLQSSVPGTRATVSKSAGTVLGNYIQLKDMEATGGATFNLYSSVDNGNNIGWNFLDPTYDYIEDTTIAASEDECFEATEIITVGGDGKHFTVESGGNARLIAGYKIELLPGTRVHRGGYLLAHVTPYGFFCDTLSTMLAAPYIEEVAEEQFPTPVKEDFFFKAYPNPTTGLFTLELKGHDQSTPVSIEIISLMGERMAKQELPAAHQYEINISGYKPGIYLVRVIQGNEVGVLRIIKQ